MSEETMEITQVGNWKPKVLILGGLIGATVGLAAAYLLVQRVGEDQKLDISAGDGVKLGVLVFGLLRSIAAIKE
jgi:gas vesicle protein